MPLKKPGIISPVFCPRCNNQGSVSINADILNPLNVASKTPEVVRDDFLSSIRALEYYHLPNRSFKYVQDYCLSPTIDSLNETVSRVSEKIVELYDGYWMKHPDRCLSLEMISDCLL